MVNDYGLLTPPLTPSTEKRSFSLTALPQLLRETRQQQQQVVEESPLIDMYSIVPAGGSGTRLWPLSRDSRPKFLLDLEGSGSSLLQSTFARLAPLSGKNRILVVTGQAHVGGVKDQLPELHDDNIVPEPSPKESMAAIGLAALLIHRRDPKAVIASFAADHVIGTSDLTFASAVASAVAAARQSDEIITIGISPDEPSTAFGYIHIGEEKEVPLDDAADKKTFDEASGLTQEPVYQVQRFKEKPNTQEAIQLLATGEYCWNAGMFVARASVLLDLLKVNNLELYQGLEKLADAWPTAQRDLVLSSVWSSLPKISIDHAIAEPAAALGKMRVVKAPLEWKDVGDYGALAELTPAGSQDVEDDKAVKVMGDDKLVFTQEASGLFVTMAGRPIVCLGIDDLVVVDTPEVLFITLKSRSQDIKNLVGICKEAVPSLK